jgi:hypothetical protein
MNVFINRQLIYNFPEQVGAVQDRVAPSRAGKPFI